jgi:phosphoribosylformimino-5-aminoimidazole carboxamide ribotide isomerase
VEIIPAIDIRGGRCVRLEQGDYERETVFSENPAEMAVRWAESGATRLHVVDLDGARSGVSVNEDVVREVIQQTRIPVQVGGGIRSEATAVRYLGDLGADRVVIGTSAVREPQIVRNLCGRWPDRVVVAVDARNGVVAVEGWTEASDVSVDGLVSTLVDLGLKRILYTDIAKDGMLSEPNFEGIRSLVERFPVKVIASGGVASIAHLQTLREIGAEAAIVGRALYTGAVDLREALGVVNG